VTDKREFSLEGVDLKNEVHEQHKGNLGDKLYHTFVSLTKKYSNFKKTMLKL